MATVQNLIDAALRLIGAIDAGEGPSTSESNDAFTALNQMLGEWSAAGVPIYKVTRDNFTLTGLSSYTIGTSGAINTARPVKIQSAAINQSGAVKSVAIVTADQWAEIQDRSRSGLFARALFYDAAYPLATIYLTPTPASGGSLELYSLKPLASFATLGDTVDLPPGYEQAIKFALAETLAPEYGRTLDQGLMKRITEAKGVIAGLNQSVLAPPAPAAQ